MFEKSEKRLRAFLRRSKRSAREKKRRAKTEGQSRYRRNGRNHRDYRNEKSALAVRAREAKIKNLPTQEKRFRSQIAQYLKQERQIEAMKMNLELMLSTRDLISVQSGFAQTMLGISKEIYGNTNDKKIYDANVGMQKALQKVNYQTRMIDELLDEGQTLTDENVDEELLSEYDSEIDELIGSETERIR